MPTRLLTALQLSTHLGGIAMPGDRLEAIADGVSAFIVQRTGRDWQQAQRSETLAGHGTPRLLLRHAPIVSVSAVTISGTALALTDIEISPEVGMLERVSGVWPAGPRRSITVDYVGGQAAPDDLVLAALEMAAFILKASGGQAAMSGGGTTSTFCQMAVDQLPTVAALLDRRTDPVQFL